MTMVDYHWIYDQFNANGTFLGHWIKLFISFGGSSIDLNIDWTSNKNVHSVWKSHKKVSFNIASEASYVYILSGRKFFKNLKLVAKECYQTTSKYSCATIWVIFKQCEGHYFNLGMKNSHARHFCMIFNHCVPSPSLFSFWGPSWFCVLCRKIYREKLNAAK